MKACPLLWAALGGAFAVACGPREDVTPMIAVQPGAAARAMALTGRFGAKELPGAPAGKARVHPLQAGEELGGTSATGGVGDLVLANDEVTFVIARGGPEVLDAADARARQDELGRFAPDLGSRRAVWEPPTSGVAPDASSAWVEARGREATVASVSIVTRFTLHAGDRALLVETTLTNAGDRAVDKPALGDAIDWGTTERFAPGKEPGFAGASSGAFLGGVGRLASYAITSTEGAIDGVSDGSRTVTTGRTVPALAPGESISYARVLAVGERPDVASLVAELTRASGGALGSVEIALVDESGRTVRAPEGAKAVLAKPGGEAVMTLRAVRDGTTLRGEVPPGDYAVTFVSGGGRRASAKGSAARIALRANDAAKATLVVSDPGFLSFSCLEPLGTMKVLARVPCKVTLTGVGGTPAPEVSPPLAARLTRHQLTRADGRVAIALAPGKYRVTASRGPEYALAQWETEVAAGKTTWGPNEGATVLSRVVDTRGYLAMDLGVPAALGADSSAIVREAVVAEAADGVEVVAGELEAVVHGGGLEGALGWTTARDADSVEAWAGLEALFSRLMAKEPATAIAGGGARTYVRVDDDGPVAGWSPDREADLVRGVRERRDVVLTNGPFLRVTANDAPIGGVARAGRDHVVEVKVHVECGAGQSVDRVTIVRASGVADTSSPLTLRPAASGARTGEATLHLRATEDDAFVVTATGSAPSADGASAPRAARSTPDGASAPRAARSTPEDPAPRAMTGAIWIDADGDGASLGRVRSKPEEPATSAPADPRKGRRP